MTFWVPGLLFVIGVMFVILGGRGLRQPIGRTGSILLLAGGAWVLVGSVVAYFSLPASFLLWVPGFLLIGAARVVSLINAFKIMTEAAQLQANGSRRTPPVGTFGKEIISDPAAIEAYIQEKDLAAYGVASADEIERIEIGPLGPMFIRKQRDQE